MMHQRNVFTVLTACVLAAVCTACANAPDPVQPTEPPAETVTETAPVTEAVTEMTSGDDAHAQRPEPDEDDAIVKALADTAWSGVNGKNGAFAAAFDGSQIVLAGQDGSVTEGWWTLRSDPDTGANSIEIFSSSEMTGDPVRSVPLYYYLEKNVLRLEDTVHMVELPESGRDAVLAEAGKLPEAADAYAQLSGSYWGGGDESYALIFLLNADGSCDMHYYDAMDGIIDEAMFYWAMSSDTICFYNEDYAPVMHFNWRMDGSTFTLSDETTGNQAACTQLTPEETADVSYQLGVLAGAYEMDGAEDAGSDGMLE